MVLTAFVIFCTTFYTQAGPAITTYFDNKKKEELAKFQAVDDFLLKDLTEAVKANEKCLALESTVKDIYSLTDSLAVAQADLLNNMEQHKLRDAVAKKLESLVAVEEAASAAIRTRMLSKIREEVTASFASDKKSKEAALNQAIAVLTAGVDGKLGKDVVGDVFKKAVSSYRDSYAKQPAGSDEILIQLEKDVAEIIKLPAAAKEAGNVYITHPVPGLSK